MIYGILILCVLEKRVLKYGSSIKSLVNWKKKHRKEPVWDKTWYNSPRGDAVGFPRIGPTDYIGGNKGHNSWPPYYYNWQQGVFIVPNIIIWYETIITMPSANMVGFGFQTKLYPVQCRPGMTHRQGFDPSNLKMYGGSEKKRWSCQLEMKRGYVGDE